MRIRSKGKANFSLTGAEEHVAMQSQNDRREEIVFSSLQSTLQQLSNSDVTSNQVTNP